MDVALKIFTLGNLKSFIEVCDALMMGGKASMPSGLHPGSWDHQDQIPSFPWQLDRGDPELTLEGTLPATEQISWAL